MRGTVKLIDAYDEYFAVEGHTITDMKNNNKHYSTMLLMFSCTCSCVVS